MSDMVELNVSGPVAELVFAHPPNNHVSTELLRSLADHLVALDQNPDVRAVILASRGRVFCAGADLASPDGLGASATPGADPVRLFYDQAIRLFGTRKPIIAAVQGAAIGAGLGLALVADFRVASTEARFAANFVRLGFHPGFGLTETLPRCVGAQAAARMFLTASRLKADEALAIGLADEVVAADDLAAATRRFAETIAENAPLALLSTRQTLRAGLQAAVERALLREHAEQTALKLTADYAEGVASVFERRPADFKGR